MKQGNPAGNLIMLWPPSFEPPRLHLVKLALLKLGLAEMLALPEHFSETWATELFTPLRFRGPRLFREPALPQAQFRQTIRTGAQSRAFADRQGTGTRRAP